MMRSDTKVFSAAWVLPIVSPPIEKGWIALQDRQIRAIGPTLSEPAAIELGPATIVLPGLVNAHTHLEFSDLVRPLGQPGESFANWVKRVIRARRGRDPLANDGISREAAIRAGIQELTQFGVAAAGEIATTPWWSDAYLQDDVKLVVQLEQLGISGDQAKPRAAEVLEKLEAFAAFNGSMGVSPHAPYSTSQELIAELLAGAAAQGLLATMHLAESQEELDFIESQSGPLVDLLVELDLWKRRGNQATIETCLQLLAKCKRALIIHGNYLTSRQREFIAANPNISIVFCPRTHKFFQHRPYVLEPLIANRINVAVGTDSRASNPDLDVLEELKTIHCQYPDLPPEIILEMGTINGAVALGLSHSHGSLEVGKTPGILAIEFFEPIIKNPIGALLSQPIKRRYWLDRSFSRPSGVTLDGRKK